MNNNKEKNLMYWAYFVVGILANFNTVLFPFFYHAKGMSEGEVALLLSATYLSAVIQPVFGYISDTTMGPKKMLKYLCVGIFIVSILLLFSNTFFTLFLFSFLFSICRNLTFPLLDNIALRYTKKSGVEYGVIRRGGSLGFGLGVVAALPIVLPLGMDYLVLLPAILSVIFLCILLSLEFDVAKKETVMKLDEYKENLKELFKSQRFVLLLLIHMCIMGMSGLKLSYQSSLLGVMGVSTAYMVLINFATIIFEILLMSVMPRLCRKMHTSITLGITVFIIILQCLLLLTSTSLVLILLAAALHGLTMALYIPKFLSYFSQVIPEKSSSTAFIVNTSMQFIVTLIINSIIIAPLVFDFGTRISFVIIILIVLFSIIPLTVLYRLDKKEKVNVNIL